MPAIRGSDVTVAYNQPFTIEGWNTDPGTKSFLTLFSPLESDRDLSLNLTYYWTCTNIDGSLCTYSVGTPITVMYAKSTTFPANTFSSGAKMNFCFHIDSVLNTSTTVSSKAICKTAIISLTASQFFPQIRASAARVNANQMVILACDSAVSGVEYSWDVATSNINSGAFEYLYAGETLAGVFKQKFVRIKPFALNQTQTYTLTCSVGYAASATWEKTSYTLVINQAPKGGEVSISPESGHELNDTFTISATGWQDPELNYPFYYSYYYKADSDYLPIRERSLCSTVKTVLPAGGINNTLTVMVVIEDSNGATTNMTKGVVIVPLQPGELAVRLKFLLGKSNMSADLLDFTQIMTLILDNIQPTDYTAQAYYYPLLIDSTVSSTHQITLRLRSFQHLQQQYPYLLSRDHP